MAAAVVTAEQVRLLQANGADEFHFYTLSRAGADLRDRAHPGGAITRSHKVKSPLP